MQTKKGQLAHVLYAKHTLFSEYGAVKEQTAGLNPIYYVNQPIFSNCGSIEDVWRLFWKPKHRSRLNSSHFHIASCKSDWESDYLTEDRCIILITYLAEITLVVWGQPQNFSTLGTTLQWFSVCCCKCKNNADKSVDVTHLCNLNKNY